MKYRNIVFDYGNVIGKFDGRQMMQSFCDTEEDCGLLCSVIFEKWAELDRGTLDYEAYRQQCIQRLPDALTAPAEAFFRGWTDLVRPIPQTIRLIEELTGQGVPVYLLSNAPTFFADRMKDSPLLKRFSGVVFSAPLKMVKPEPAIYEYLFRTYNLKPEECFFLDDLEPNVNTARSLGMDSMVFTGDIEKVRSAIGFPAPKGA